MRDTRSDERKFFEMATPDPQRVTRLLDDVSGGDADAAALLLPLVYDQLRALAQAHLASERPGHTLQATALVHEAFIKLAGQEDVRWQNRAHFFGVAAQAIRRILIDHARTRNRLKRGGDHARVPLDDAAALPGAANAAAPIDLLALDEALVELSALDPRQARIVELRYFAGMSMKEIAEVTGVSLRTAEGDWAMARAWLRRALDAEP